MDSLQQEGQGVVYENTYLLTPEEHGKKFNATLVDRILREEVSKRIGAMEYDSNKAPQVAKDLTDLIKERIRAQQFARYNIVVEVIIGQRLGQAMRTASRGLWNPSTDSWASTCYENDTLYCVAMAFGLYYD